MSQVGLYFIALLGLNIVTGYSGQISLGQGAFMGVGGYTTAYSHSTTAGASGGRSPSPP